jgi:HPt (histidine-containing phosphotransfer) domain-containing protein
MNRPPEDRLAQDAAIQPALSAALDQLWAKFLPQIVERVAILDSAAAALADGLLSPAQCALASAAAHKLAGVLGTFGLAPATDLAREAEIFYSGNPQTGRQAAARLRFIAAQLRSLVECRESASSF